MTEEHRCAFIDQLLEAWLIPKCNDALARYKKALLDQPDMRTNAGSLPARCLQEQDLLCPSWQIPLPMAGDKTPTMIGSTL